VRAIRNDKQYFRNLWRRFAAEAGKEKLVKKIGLIIAGLLISTASFAQYSNSNLNGAYSVQFGSPETYSWSKTFTCPTNSSITYIPYGSITGTNVVFGTGTFDGNGNLSVSLTDIGVENATASGNTMSVTWNSACQVTNVNYGHVVYQPVTTKTQTGTYSIQANGTGTMSEVGSSQSQTVVLAGTTGGLSSTVLMTNPQVNGKTMGTGIAVHQ
jgi:hypothetical protein